MSSKPSLLATTPELPLARRQCSNRPGNSIRPVTEIFHPACNTFYSLEEMTAVISEMTRVLKSMTAVRPWSGGV